jgi:hypothetical protein
MGERFIDQEAHSSTPFRLSLAKYWIKLDDFIKAAEKDFSDLKTEDIQKLPESLNSIPLDHSSDTIRISPKSDEDASIFKQMLEEFIPDVKKILENFVMRSRALMGEHYSFTNEYELKSIETKQLLKRLENNILPNIIPDESLLGKPASFSTILNASAFYRLYLLTTEDNEIKQELSNELEKLERLTAKSFEVSFIQAGFDDWKEGKDVSS